MSVPSQAHHCFILQHRLGIDCTFQEKYFLFSGCSLHGRHGLTPGHRGLCNRPDGLCTTLGKHSVNAGLFYRITKNCRTKHVTYFLDFSLIVKPIHILNLCTMLYKSLSGSKHDILHKWGTTPEFVF